MQRDQQHQAATGKMWQERDQRDMEAKKLETQAKQQEKANDLNAQEMGYRVQADDFVKQGHLSPEQMALLEHTKDPSTRVAILKSLTSMGETTAKTVAEQAKAEAAAKAQRETWVAPVQGTTKQVYGAGRNPMGSLDTAPPATMTAEDVAAANAMGADVTTKVGSSTITSRAKVPANTRADELHSTQKIVITDPVTKKPKEMVIRYFRNGATDLVDPSAIKATDGQAKPVPTAVMQNAPQKSGTAAPVRQSAPQAPGSLQAKTAALINALKK